jgi:hypothetical protein
MLAAIFSQVGMAMINSILGQALEAFKAYENKQISVEQLKDQLYGLMVGAAKDIEVAYADALAKTYASFMQTMATSKIMQRTWAFVTISQAVMILWFQIGIPIVVIVVRNLTTADKFSWPSSGSTADWAYLLVAACLGMAPLVLKSGPGAGGITDRLKSMIGK